MLSARVVTILCLFSLGNLMPMPGKHLIETEESNGDAGLEHNRKEGIYVN